jgi:hypothetical protein
MNKTFTIFLLILFSGVNAIYAGSKPEAKQQIYLNQKTPIIVQIKEPPKVHSMSEKIYDGLKDWSGAIIAISGFIAGYFLIRRKLIEKHISTALEDIQKANERTMIESTKLVDEYITKSYESKSLDKEDLQNVLDKIKEVYIVSQSGSSECQTLLFYLKFTIQESIRHYPGGPDHFERLLNHDFYITIVQTLENVIFYSKQVVTIPKSTRTKSLSMLKPKYAKFTTGARYSTYRHFNLGFISDPNSALFLMFIYRINFSYNTLLKRSAFKLFWNSNMLSVIMYMEKIYAPLKIEKPKTIDSDDVDYSLYLIGFEILNYSSQSGGNKIVRLIYSNPNDGIHFMKSTINKGVLKNYIDSTIKDSGFILSKGYKESYKVIESVSIDFNLDYLEKLFVKNKRQIKRNLPVKRGVYKWFSQSK